MHSLIGHPLTSDEMSVCIKDYNDQMNPHITIFGCSVCGIRDLSGDQHNLNLSQLSSLIVPDIKFQQYMTCTPEIKSCFNIVVVNISGKQTGFYLNSNFLKSVSSPTSLDNHVQMRIWSHSDVASLCSACFIKLGGENQVVPQYSISAGYDFGHPLRAGLKPLTILERKLISRNIIFSTIIKLVASTGKNSMQHGLQGHVIAMPHEGAKVLAATNVLPNIDGVTETMSVMFVGSAEQWRSASGTANDKQRANFVLAHRSIFQVRPDILFSWLRLLKLVNPFYSDVEILNCTNETCSNLENLPNILIDKTHVASEEKTIQMEQFTVADVAHVRSQTADGDENSVGFNGVLLQNVALPHAPVISVLESLHNTITTKSNETESNLSCSDQKSNNVHAVRCQNQPVNEFLENDILFLGAFPDLFFLGGKLPKSGSVPTSFSQHLLRQADNRFAQVDEIIFTLFNQSQRHAAARQVSINVRSDTQSVQLFTDIIEAPNFMDDLKSAIASPDSKEAKQLLATIMPLLRMGGRSVPFGPLQRSIAVSKLCAYLHYFGLPGWFVTISPNDVDSVLILRLASPLIDNTDPIQCQFVVPHIDVRLETLANNPAAAAEVFIRQINAVFSCLVGLPLQHNLKQSHGPVGERRQGIFGVPVAHFACIEIQGRGSLHAHFIVMGGIAPDVMQSVVNDPDCLSAVQKKLILSSKQKSLMPITKNNRSILMIL